MPEFDPYLSWLGIPTSQRPPTYYQLLGVDPAISDPAVINALAIQRIAYVRNFQRSEHGELCARILEELSVAEAVLTNPSRRTDYDRSLASAQKTVAARPSVNAAAPVKVRVTQRTDAPI